MLSVTHRHDSKRARASVPPLPLPLLAATSISFNNKRYHRIPSLEPTVTDPEPDRSFPRSRRWTPTRAGR